MKKTSTLIITSLLYLSTHAQAWIELGTGANALNANNSIWTLMADQSGNIYAAGGFTDSATYIEGSSYIAVWNGTTWSPLGTGANALNANNAIYTMTQDASGNIYAAGNFLDPNGRQYVAKWNGTTWSEIGIDTIGLNATEPIQAVTTDAQGNVYAAGDFTDFIFAYGHRYVAKWNGSMWSEVGLDSIYGLNADSTIYALATDRHGNLYAAGAFTDSAGYSYVAKWNDTAWSELGTTDSTGLFANGQINAMIIDTAGNIYVGGAFQDTSGYSYIAKWNGTKWTELGTPSFNEPIQALTFDSAGNVYAGGQFNDSTGNIWYVAEWDGSQILTLNGNSPFGANGPILAMTSDKFGNIYAAGQFKDQNFYQYVAEFTGNTPNGITPVADEHLHLYPNPTSGLVFIQADHLSGTATIDVMDGLGRSLYTQADEGPTVQAQIDLSGFAPGVYTLVIHDDAGAAYTRRIVKE